MLTTSAPALRHWLASRSHWNSTSVARLWAFLLLVALLGGVGGAGTGWWASNRTQQEYTASVVFAVENIAPDMQFLSFSKAIEAEQAARVLKAGRTGEIIPPEGSAYRWEWTTGPASGQVSFRVHSARASEANRVATKLLAEAGTAGRALLNPTQPRPGLSPQKVIPATAQYRLGTQTVALNAGLGSAIAVGLFVLGTLMPRDRHRGWTVNGQGERPRLPGEPGR